MKQHEENKLAWNEAAQSYRESIDADIKFLKAGGKNFCSPELNYLTDLSSWCETALHLQCAGGTDTLSLLNLGAKKVIGVDISDEMIAIAREKTKRLQMNAEWICCDILSLQKSHSNCADLVYTGRGAINWIMDIEAWANTIYQLLRPHGKFYVFEGHPITYFFNTTSTTLELDPNFTGYFSKKIYRSQDWPETYVGNLKKDNTELAIKNERVWTISEIITALINTGLKLIKFEEHPDKFWEEFPNLEDSEREKFPNTFSIWMEK